MVLGLHCAPVRSDVPVPELSITLFFSRHTVFTARPTEEVGTSAMAITASRSRIRGAASRVRDALRLRAALALRASSAFHRGTSSWPEAERQPPAIRKPAN